MHQKRPHLHVVSYSRPGGGKSTFAASFDVAGPILVNCFDGRSKAGPYLRRGDKVTHGQLKDGVTFDRVTYKGDLMSEIRYYHDLDPEKPDAYALFRKDIRGVDPEKWGTIVLDSLTSCALSAYLEQRFVINKSDEGKYSDSKQLKWRSGMTDQLEYTIARRFIGFESNVIVIAHVEEKEITVPSKDGPQKISKRIESVEESEEGKVQIVRGISAPGRLSKRDGLLSQFGECYRHYVVRNAKGQPEWRIQTRPDDDWVASTQIDAPDGCNPDFIDLWENYDKPITALKRRVFKA